MAKMGDGFPVGSMDFDSIIFIVAADRPCQELLIITFSSVLLLRGWAGGGVSSAVGL